MHDQSAPNNTIRTAQLDLGVHQNALGVPVFVRSNVPEVPDVAAISNVWSTVRFAVWIVVGAAGLAALSKVCAFVNVKAVQASRQA